jgi:hypothetical protein
MKKSLGRGLVRRRPSPSMVVACLALAVALSGASYAAIVLPPNSVGTLQLKRNAVKSPKVARNTLKGVDIKESTLARVPLAASATNATNAANADKLDGLHANQLVRGTTLSSNTISDNFDTCAYTTLLSKTVTAPISGVLLVWGNVGAVKDFDDADPSTLGVRVAVDATAVTTEQAVHLVDLGTREGSAQAMGATPVSAGSHIVDVQASECSTGMAFIVNQSITTLFVPFGNDGIQGALKIGAMSRSSSTANGGSR